MEGFSCLQVVFLIGCCWKIFSFMCLVRSLVYNIIYEFWWISLISIMLYASLYNKEEILCMLHGNLSSLMGKYYGEFDICFYVEISVVLWWFLTYSWSIHFRMTSIVTCMLELSLNKMVKRSQKSTFQVVFLIENFSFGTKRVLFHFLQNF